MNKEYEINKDNDDDNMSAKSMDKGLELMMYTFYLSQTF